MAELRAKADELELQAAEREAVQVAKNDEDQRLTDALEVPRSAYIARMDALRADLLAWRDVGTLAARWAEARREYNAAVAALIEGRGNSWRVLYDSSMVEGRHALTKAAPLLSMVAS